MKKYILGGIVGFILAFTVSAHAEVVSMIGKVIDGAFPVKVDGKTLDTQAIVVEGTSYLPVRAFGDATGYDVKFDADMGITLTKKQETTAQNPQPMPPTSNPDPVAEAFNNAKQYKLQSSFLDIPDKEYKFVQIDGESYLPMIFLGKYYKVVDPKISIRLPESPEVLVDLSNNYSKDVTLFINKFDGETYVKLSALGLKATVNGHTLVIEKQ